MSNIIVCPCVLNVKYLLQIDVICQQKLRIEFGDYVTRSSNMKLDFNDRLDITLYYIDNLNGNIVTRET